ncbi:hypothetical protein E1B28_001117 [Marasmius oreades]|uniref:Uncharacterized protein n=1 Tax=Marasmius oreades TaxID=181124 RepID=A0A9P8AF34_9AGAR|nr:uncharacterized protein E1B28_001117 [Marasmius oreades]KAG7099254.1 hypothetical protein E1B28_001117 [Marasmius oreades]
MRSFSILSFLVAALVSEVVIASPGLAPIRLAHHGGIAKRHAEGHALWNAEKRQASGARFTWYKTGLGACGGYNGDDDRIVALNEHQWDGGAHCGQKITIEIGGKTAEATITDLCPFDSCPYGALDFSSGLFKIWASDPAAVGVMTGNWWYGSGGGNNQQTTTSHHEEPTTPPPPPPTTSTSSTTPPPPPPSTTTTTSSTSTSMSSSSSISSSTTSSSSSSSSSESATPTAGAMVIGNIMSFQKLLGNLGGLVASGATITA